MKCFQTCSSIGKVKGRAGYESAHMNYKLRDSQRVPDAGHKYQWSGFSSILKHFTKRPVRDGCKISSSVMCLNVSMPSQETCSCSFFHSKSFSNTYLPGDDAKRHACVELKTMEVYQIYYERFYSLVMIWLHKKAHTCNPRSTQPLSGESWVAIQQVPGASFWGKNLYNKKIHPSLRGLVFLIARDTIRQSSSITPIWYCVSSD